MKADARALIRRAVILSLVIMTTFMFSSIDTFAAAKKPVKIKVTPRQATLTVGKQVRIKVKSVKPAKASKAVKYKSSNKKVAAVTQKGVVKARKKGNAVITVTSKKSKKVKAKVKITVKAKPKAKPPAKPNPAPTPQKPQTPAPKKSLVIYFSRGENILNASEYSKSLGDDIDAMTSASVLPAESGAITGNNGILAGWISEALGTKTYSIHVKNPYPQLKKETQQIVLNQEQINGTLPEVEACTEDLSQYDIIYLGFPNWYGEPPRALYTFLNENNLDGKTIVPFTSHDRNGFSDSIQILKAKLPNSAVLEDGLIVDRKNVMDAKSVILEWVAKVSKEAENAKSNPLATVAGQKEAAKKLIGQTLTKEEVIAAVGQYTKFVTDTNGCTHDIESGRFYYPGFVIYSRADEDGSRFVILSVD